jgi:pimeloyl-ACP methyl ester carboxylesterase
VHVHVLVHGCGKTGRFWDELRARLGERPVLAVSLPGRPPTQGTPCASAAEAADWLAATVSAAGIERAVVVGHSFGGGVAIEYARRRPAGLVGLGLVATGARLRVRPDILQRVDAAARAGVPADLTDDLYLPTTDPRLVARTEALGHAVPPTTTAADWRATDRFDRLGELDEIAVPTLVVGGTADRLTIPKYAEYLAAHIPRARLCLVPGAGHMLPVEHAAELATALTTTFG